MYLIFFFLWLTLTDGESSAQKPFPDCEASLAAPNITSTLFFPFDPFSFSP